MMIGIRNKTVKITKMTRKRKHEIYKGALKLYLSSAS